MNVSVVRGGRELLDRFADEWRELCAEGPCQAPFYAPEWARAYHEAFASGAELVFILVRDGDRLRGLLPLTAARWRGIPWGRRWLRSMGNVHSPRFDVIHGVGDGAQVGEALATFLLSWRGWDVIQLRMVAENNVLAQVTSRLEEEGAPLNRYGRADVPYVCLDPTASEIEATLTRLSRNARSSLRRAIKRLEAYGEIQTTLYSSNRPLSEIHAQRDLMYELEASGWKGDAGTAIAQDPSLRTFYDRIIDLTHESSQLQLFRLEARNEPVGVMLNVTGADQIYWLKFGLNESHKEWSPGHLTILHLVASLPKGRYSVLDMGGTMDDFKRRWTQVSQPVRSYLLIRPTPRGRLLHKLLSQVEVMFRRKSAGFKPVYALIRRWADD